MAIHTVIGAFDDRQSAESAVTRLVQAGCERGDVHIEAAGGASTASASDTASGVGTTSGTPKEEDRGLMSSIGHFFTSLFGVDNDDVGHAGRYTEAVRRGSVVVVVDSDSEEQAHQAAAVLHECGAIDVDERAQQWRSEGWDDQGIGSGSPAIGATTGAATQGASERQGQGGGVRIIQRPPEMPVRELVRQREGTQRLPGEGMSRTDIERERALAADDLAGERDVDRDRDALTDRERGTISERGTSASSSTTDTTRFNPDKPHDPR